jgi:hypothetical protein
MVIFPPGFFFDRFDAIGLSPPVVIPTAPGLDDRADKSNAPAAPASGRFPEEHPPVAARYHDDGAGQTSRSSANWGVHAPLGRRRLTIAGAICLKFRLSLTARGLPW